MLRHTALIGSLLLASCSTEDRQQPISSNTPLVVGDCWREKIASGLSLEYWPPVQIAEVGDQLLVVDRINDSSGLWIRKYSIEKVVFENSYQQLQCPGQM